MAKLSKARKPDNFESHKLALPIFEVFVRISLDVNLSFNIALLTFLLYVKTDLDDSIDYGNFSLRDYLLLIRKDSVTYIHGLTVCVKDVLSLSRDLPLENCAGAQVRI